MNYISQFGEVSISGSKKLLASNAMVIFAGIQGKADGIADIPRHSENEENIIAFIEEFSKKYGCELKKQSGAKNLCLHVPGKGRGIDAEPVILQAHLDMVAEKLPESNHNFDTDPIIRKFVGKKIDTGEELHGPYYLTAPETTLGADNGIGIALALAAIDLDNRPPLQILFTSREESDDANGVKDLKFDELGIHGAFNVINLDNNIEGQVCVSSGGCQYVDTRKDLSVIPAKLPQKTYILSGFHGGHSGEEVGKNICHITHLFLQFLSQIGEKGCIFEIAKLVAGNATNALPKGLEITLGTDDHELFQKYCEEFLRGISKKYSGEKGGKLEVRESETIPGVVSFEESISLCNTLTQVHIGVYSRNETSEVTTSLNLGQFSIDTGVCFGKFLFRSNIQRDIVEAPKIFDPFSKKGFVVTQGQTLYPWESEQDNSMRDLFLKTDREVQSIFGSHIAPESKSTHSYLEVGDLLTSLRDYYRRNFGSILDGKKVSGGSIGPEILLEHNPSESLGISSVYRVGKTLELMLEELCLQKRSI